MSITSTITYNNVAGEPADVLDLLSRDLNAAFALWSSLLAGSANLRVNVDLVGATAAGRAEAAPGNIIILGQAGGVTLVEGAPAHELRTGVDTASTFPDINIRIQDTYLKGELWLDPTPQDAGDIPAQRTDFVSVALHEIAHALGFTGYIGSSVEQTYQSTFDQNVASTGGSLYFVGTNAESVYGGPVPLTSGNVYHFGNNAPGPGSNLIPDMMNGIVYERGHRYSPSPLDVATLSDLGYGTVRSDRIAAPLNGAHFDAGAGLDTLVFSAASTAYAMRPTALGFNIGGPSGYAAEVINTERLQFSDHLLALDLAGDAGDGFRLYQAAFNRTPDVPGLSYWVRALDRGATLHDVATGFIDSAEFKAVYGATPSPAHIIDLFYHNVLGRAGEPSGAAYWTGLLDHGAATADVLVGFSESAENIARVAPAIANGVVLDLAPFV